MKNSNIDLIVPFWKPIDWSSFDVVKKVKNQIKPNKVGHAGSLDPFAEGVLVLCTGRKTKESDKLMLLQKEYEGTIKLGIETNTLDPTGTICKDLDVPKLNSEKINNILLQFMGRSYQVPPMFSALKRNGVPLYKLARKGINIKLEPRPINIYKIELLDYNNDEIKFKVSCSKGTYIRSLARDIANKLNTCGHLIHLCRTKVGSYTKANAIRIENLNEWLLSVT